MDVHFGNSCEFFLFSKIMMAITTLPVAVILIKGVHALTTPVIPVMPFVQEPLTALVQSVSISQVRDVCAFPCRTIFLIT